MDRPRPGLDTFWSARKPAESFILHVVGDRLVSVDDANRPVGADVDSYHRLRIGELKRVLHCLLQWALEPVDQNALLHAGH